MLTHPLAERLRGLGMAAMADAFPEMQSNSTAADLSREDWLGLLLDREVTARDNKRPGPITYSVGGKQYVAVVVGRTVSLAAFVGDVGTKMLNATPEGGALFVFSLD
jgi:hypothetical protein